MKLAALTHTPVGAAATVATAGCVWLGATVTAGAEYAVGSTCPSEPQPESARATNSRPILGGSNAIRAT
jgi:hypothetical protein